MDKKIFITSLTNNLSILFLVVLIYVICFSMGLLCAPSAGLNGSSCANCGSGVGMHKDPFDLVNKDIWAFTKTNLLIVLITASGAITFGFISLVEITLNAFISGTIIGSVINGGAPLINVVMLTLPHGIFEVGGLCLAGTAGFIPTKVLIILLNGRNCAFY